MRRAQVSLEMFFVLSVFILLLLWLYNYSETIKHTDTEYSQLSFISSSLAATASKSCALGVNITWTPPCVYGFDLAEPKDYWIQLGRASNKNDVDVYILDHSRVANAACAVDIAASEGVDPLPPLYVSCRMADPQTADVEYCVSPVSAGLPYFKITTGACV